MLNSIIFKSGNKVYKLTPNLYSTSDSILNLHCISDTVKEYVPTSPAFNRCFAFSTNDEYFLLKDFESYRLAQEKINNLYQNRQNWSKMCLANIAKSGHFSSDRTIEDYVKDIWHLNRVKI